MCQKLCVHFNKIKPVTTKRITKSLVKKLNQISNKSNADDIATNI